jgi:uncharacterized protein involved in exopolysaccharide biosynthesis
MAVGRLSAPLNEPNPTSRIDPPDLGTYLGIIRDGRYIIVAGLLLGLIGGFVYAWTRPPVYEATATLLISRSKIGTDISPPAAAQAFRAFVVNKALVSKVLKEFGLDRPPEKLDPVGFIDKHLSVEEIVNGDLVRVHVKLADASLAAKVANRLVALATDLSRRVNTEESLAVRDFIKLQLDESFARLRGLERDLVAYKREAQLELRRSEVTTLLDQRRELIDLSVQLEGERASLRQAEHELSGRTRVLPAPRAPNSIAALEPEPQKPSPRTEATTPSPISGSSPPSSGTPFAPAQQAPSPSTPSATMTPQPEAARPLPPKPESVETTRDERAWLAQAYSSPLIDPVYEILEYRVATGRARVADLERRRRLLSEQYGLTAPTLKQLTELYAREIAQARLQADYDLSSQVYADLFTRYEQARIQVASRSTELKVLDPAIEQPTSIAPSPVIAAALGALALGGIATLFVFARAYARRLPAG